MKINEFLGFFGAFIKDVPKDGLSPDLLSGLNKGRPYEGR